MTQANSPGGEELEAEAGSEAGASQAAGEEGAGVSGAVEATAREASPASGRRSGSAYWVAAGIFLSRISGLVRARIFARYFGTSIAADAFNAALRMPNVLQNLLGEGTLSASFIPVYSELLKDGREEEAGRVAGAVFALLLAIAGGLALLGTLAAPIMVDVLATGFHGVQRDLTVACVRIIFPMTGILVLSAWALGILNSHRRFFVPYVAPVVWNAAMIAVMVALGSRTTANSLVIAVAWGALAGGLLQFLVQLPFVLRLERRLRVRLDTKLPRVREAVSNALPAILGRGVVQLSAYIDVWLASFLAEGAVAIMTYAMTLYLLPISLFGMSVAAAELPELSRERSGETEVLRARVNAGLRQIYFFVVPSFIGFLVLGRVIVAALYQNGDFGPIQSLQVYLTLSAFSIGLVASTGTRLFSSTYFALHDTRTPAKTATVRVVLSGVVGAALMVPFSHLEVAPGAALGPVGLGIGAGVAAWVEWWLLRRNLAPRIGRVGAGAGTLGRMFGAALLAAAAGWWVADALPQLHVILRAVLVLVPYGVVYLIAAHLLGLRQGARLLRRVLRR